MVNALCESPADAAYLAALLSEAPPGTIGAVRLRAGAPALSLPALMGSGSATRPRAAAPGKRVAAATGLAEDKEEEVEEEGTSVAAVRAGLCAVDERCAHS